MDSRFFRIVTSVPKGVSGYSVWRSGKLTGLDFGFVFSGADFRPSSHDQCVIDWCCETPAAPAYASSCRSGRNGRPAAGGRRLAVGLRWREIGRPSCRGKTATHSWSIEFCKPKQEPGPHAGGDAVCGSMHPDCQRASAVVRDTHNDLEIEPPSCRNSEVFGALGEIRGFRSCPWSYVFPSGVQCTPF
jgi:hypothetical protein